MKNGEGKLNRSKFLKWLGVASVFTAVGIRFMPKKTEVKKIKMLAQDGSLVEIDASLLQTEKKRITDAELQSWVKK